MMTKRAEIGARKDRILAIAIEEYIKTVSPVSSSFIAKGFPLDLSSATIRNILADLEEDGYLTHPHTSAGRVPTQQGYRYYVDNLMHEIQLLEEEKRLIKSEYEKESRELEFLLDKTSRVLADITHYTSIVSVDGWDNKIFLKGTNFVVDYPEYNDIQKIEKILSALDEKETLLEIINQYLDHKINIYIGYEMHCTEINSCSLAVSSYRTKSGPSGRIAVLGPTRMDYQRVVSALDYFSDLMEEFF